MNKIFFAPEIVEEWFWWERTISKDTHKWYKSLLNRSLVDTVVRVLVNLMEIQCTCQLRSYSHEKGLVWTLLKGVERKCGQLYLCLPCIMSGVPDMVDGQKKRDWSWITYLWREQDKNHLYLLSFVFTNQCLAFLKM